MQLVDTPPFAAEPFDAVLVNVARGADALALLLSPADPEVLEQAAAALRFLARCRIVPAGRRIPEELGPSARVLPVSLVLSKVDLLAGEEVSSGAEIAGLVRDAMGRDLACHAISTRLGSGLEPLRFARVWGSARFEGQPVERDHPLAERDVGEVRPATRYGIDDAWSGLAGSLW